MDLKGRHFISTQDWDNDELEHLIGCAAELKAKMKQGIPHKYLDSKTLMMYPEWSSPVVQSAFGVGIVQLGGDASTLLGHTEAFGPPREDHDMIRVASRHGHGIAMSCRPRRPPDLTGGWDINEIVPSASVPMFNMQSELLSPVQAIADLMTIRERFGNDLSGLRFVCSWAHSPSPPWRMPTAHSLVLLLTRFGMDVVLAHPPEFGLDCEILEQAEKNSAASAGSFETVDSMDQALRKAAVAYPISWSSSEGVNPKKKVQLAAKYKGWVFDGKKLNRLAPDGIYMHCLPAERGSEVTEDVIDSPRSVVWDQAENVLHTAKALMTLTM